MSLSNFDLEARTTLLSIFLLCSSLHSFRLDVSLLVTAIAVLFSRGRVLVGLVFTSPLIAFFVLWSLLLGGIEKIPTFIALITLGFLVLGLKPEEIAYALMFFRIPPKIAYAICISMRFLRIAFTDLQNISSVLSIESRGFKKYANLLKAFTSVLILRSFSIAESLYSRGFDLNKRIVLVRKPKVVDFILLTCSICVFIHSIFLTFQYILIYIEVSNIFNKYIFHLNYSHSH